MARKILCVAEKPAIAKAVAQHLSGGQFQTRPIQGNQYVKNYCFSFNFNPTWGPCDVNMTSVLGHLTETEFPQEYSNWVTVPPASLFEAPIKTDYADRYKAVAANITQQARYSQILFIWTDCDREGEHIGSEIRQAAQEGKPNIEVRRAKFSNTERAHVIRAAQQPVPLDDQQVNAVAARIELDLRLGSVFTRFTTLLLQHLGAGFDRVDRDGKKQPISYGSCQFPTLGFVVDRFKKVKNFVPEEFWSIKVTHRKESMNGEFSWRRNRLFDRASVVVMFERCLDAHSAKVVKVQERPTSKWRPLPLTTVELQKLGSMYLRLPSARVMNVAEKLYQRGFISYPRTETDQFDKGIDLRKIVEKQTQDNAWGQYAQGLLSGQFKQPRSGRHNDQAHPPIHPVNYVAPQALDYDEQRVYEFVVRRFLACCSDDAKGHTTTIEIEYGDEKFFATGLLVLERNYLGVYPYEKWDSSQQLPRFSLHETFVPTEAKIVNGKTSPPGYLTEPDLIALMDANGIGTDATMADHIDKIQKRDYIKSRNGSGPSQPSSSARGGRGGRGRGRGGAAAGSAGRGSVNEFEPTPLGLALIEGYDNIGLDVSLSKPFLRKEMEIKMREICAGTKSRRDCVQETLEQYREVFVKASQQQDVLKSYARRYVVEGEGFEGIV